LSLLLVAIVTVIEGLASTPKGAAHNAKCFAPFAF
jgi:hypothetical protein